MKHPTPTTHRGYQAESQALNFLQKKGLCLIERNFRCKLGEIDLIMSAGNILAFVEVRMRNNPNYGSAEETVTRSKQLKIIRTAAYYLQQHPRLAQKSCRFDVVSVNEKATCYKLFNTDTINWIPDAFQTTEWV